MSEIRFGKSVSSKGQYSKTYSERYRWNNDEKLDILAELQADVTITLKPAPAFVALGDIEDREDRFGVMGHFRTGFSSLDKLTLGFDPGEYIVLGAGTNNGKTQLATYIAKTQATGGTPTLYISRELSNTEMKQRLRFIGSNLDNLWVPDSSRLSPDDLIALIIAFKKEHEKAFIIVDHLHAFYRGDKLTEVLGMLSATLRELAQDLNVGILALSQFNRQPYKDEEGPSNFHLKESGYIADDAYTIILAWRTSLGLHIRLTKTRRLDLGDVVEPMITLRASKGRLYDGEAPVQESFIK